MDCDFLNTSEKKLHGQKMRETETDTGRGKVRETANMENIDN